MKQHTAKVVLLIVLVGLWVALLVLRQPTAPAPRAVQPHAASGEGRTADARGGGGELPHLKTELLDLPRPAYTPEVQNIFGEPPPPPKPAAAAGAAPGAPATPPAPPPDPFAEGAKAFRYVGFLRRGGAMIAFIIQGQQVYTVPVGDTLDSRYRVQAITEDNVVLSSPGGDKQVRLDLSPTAPAGPPVPGAAPPPAPGPVPPPVR